jgi:hypothetical protein
VTNARSESILERPAFREAAIKRRALIPVYLWSFARCPGWCGSGIVEDASLALSLARLSPRKLHCSLHG